MSNIAIDDQDSEATGLSSNESCNESQNELDESFEVANILGQKFNLPKDLCDDHELFNDVFSMSTWNQVLNPEEKQRLSKFLPTFPHDQKKEEQKTVEEFFNGKLSRFGHSPLDTFFNNLQDGNYRPDIAHYRKLILKAEERDQKLRECERVSELATKLVISRDRLLKSVYRHPSDRANTRTSKSTPFSKLSSSMVRANSRFAQELQKISVEVDFELSEDEEIHAVNNTQLSEHRNENCVKDTRIYSTLFNKQTNVEPILDANMSNDAYIKSLKNYRKRKIIDPEHSEMDIDEIKLKDVITRANFTKKYAQSMFNKRSMINETVTKNSLPTKLPQHYGKNQIIKMPLNKSNWKIGVQEKHPINSQSEETDEESWIKANIIKVEPTSHQKSISFPQNAKLKNTEIINSRKRPHFESAQRSTKKIIIDKDGGIISHGDYNEIELIGPELKHETQTCFLSLIRDMFCSTPDHRMKLEELRRRINVWLKNPVAITNTWYKDVNFWGSLLFSAVHFLSGEFLDQPEGFVPYLEFKSHLNIYQWIGAGRDNDSSMKNLNQYWLSRQEEMGIKSKQKTKTIVTNVPENNVDNHLRHSISPPSSRCKSNWKVRAANEEDLSNFHVQERRRFENPYKSFIYHQHGYESVVGPVTSPTSAAKIRDNSILKSDRPGIVTANILVRDAIARLPSGEGSRNDICEMMKYSQYVLSHVLDKTLCAIIANILDYLCSEADPCVKFDVDKKVWIYLHRNRSVEDFEKLHQNERKKALVKTQPLKILTQTQSGGKITKIGFPNSFNKSMPCSTTMEFNQKNQFQSSPPPLKVFTKKIVKPSIVDNKNVEPFDAEASLEAQAIVKSSELKTNRVTIKNSPQTSFVQSPKVTTIIGSKKIITASPNAQIQKLTSAPTITVNKPTVTASPTLVQNKTILKMSPNFGKNINNPQQKIILTTAANTAQAKGGKLITFSQNQTPMLSQQKQILTNVIVQQQKAKSTQNHVLLTTNKNQPITIVSSGPSTSTQSALTPSQVIIQQPNTTSLVGSSPQQRQAILQLKQLKDPNTSTMIIKPHIIKTSDTSSQPTLVNISKLPKTTSQSQQQTQKFAQFAVVGKDNKNIVSITSSSQPTLVTSSNVSKTVTSVAATQITSSPSTSLKIVQGGSISAQQILNAKFINLQTLNNKAIKSTGGIKMLNTQGYSKLPNVPIIIKNNPTQTVQGQGMMLQLNPSANGTFLLNSQGQPLKVQGNILTQGNSNILSTNQSAATSQAQTVMLGNQVLKVQSINRLNPSQKISPGNGTVVLSSTSGIKSSPSEEGQSVNQVLGPTLKILKNVVKPGAAQSQQTAKVVLATPTNQTMQQIILPANFQGIKTLQGFKVIQQARILPSYTTNSINTNTNVVSSTEENQATTNTPKEPAKD